MTPISSMSAGAAAAVGKVLEASKIRDPGEASQSRPLKPVMDEYVPERPQEPSGRYWAGKDGDGQLKIYFDDPDRGADAPQKPEEAPGKAEQGAKVPERKDCESEERYACDTGKADREIEKLKKKQQELEQRLHTETDEARIRALERQLAQVERELKQKDNDTYRKQHSTFMRLS